MPEMKEIVKPMERGQITIPVKIRKKMGITPNTFLWVYLVNDNSVVIQPVKAPVRRGKLDKFLKMAENSGESFWSKEDDIALKKVRKKGAERLKKLTQW